MKREKKKLRLNKSEFLYLTMEDLTPSVAQLITLRFETKHSPEKIRAAFLHMFDLYPRLRAIVEPTLFSYRLRIIKDGNHVNALFEDAFRVENNIGFDTEAYKKFRKDLLNDSFTLQHSLPIKIRFLPEENLLFIAIQHITCDGLGWLHMTSSLLAYLNEKETTPIPVDNPSMIPGIFKKPYISAPRQLYDSWLLQKEDKKRTRKDNVINPSEKSVDFFGFADMQQKYLSYKLSDLKPKAKELGYSLNVYLLTAVARTFFNLYDETKGDTVGIRLSYDLRPYFEEDPPLFGNYVTSSVLRAYRKNMDAPKVMMTNIQTQLSEAIDRLKTKKLTYPWFVDKLFTLLGKKLYSRGILFAKKKSLFQPTVHFSTVGSGDWLNKAGEKAKLKDSVATVPTFGLFLTMMNIDGIFNVNISYPTAEFSQNTITGILDTFENELGFLLTI